jgi:hypothetical protein
MGLPLDGEFVPVEVEVGTKRRPTAVETGLESQTMTWEIGPMPQQAIAGEAEPRSRAAVVEAEPSRNRRHRRPCFLHVKASKWWRRKRIGVGNDIHSGVDEF